MQNGNWSRLVVEALIVFCIGMGSILLWDSGATFFKSGLSWKQSWRTVMEQAVNDTTPSQVCGNEPIIFRPNVLGQCSILSNSFGCCTSTPPITPLIAIGTCSSRCLNLYSAYWCTVSCQGNFNVDNGTSSLCAESVQILLDECQTCSPALLPFVTPAQFVQGTFIRVSSAGGCFLFHQRALTGEQGPPVIVNTTVTTSGGGDSNNLNLFPFIAILSAEIRNGQVPYGGQVSCVSPSGKPGNPKKLTSNDFEKLGNGNWRVKAQCAFGPKVPRGLWNWFLRIDNTNSSAVSDNVAATQFEVNSTFVPPGGNFGIVLLCEPPTPADKANALGVAAITFTSNQKADVVTCCDPDSKCTVSGAGSGIVIGQLNAGQSALDLSSFVGTIINLAFPAGTAGVVLSGGSAVVVIGTLTCGSKLFGTDGSSLQVAPGGQMFASIGCLLDLSTILVIVNSSITVTGPGTPGEASLEIQQGMGGSGTLIVSGNVLIGPGVVITINGMPNSIVAEFLLGITFLNPADVNNGNQQVIVAGGIVFGSSHAGFLLGFIALEVEPPPATRATTQPNGASVVICNGPGNAVAGNAIVSAGPNTGVFIRPKNAGDAACNIKRKFRLVASPTNLNGFDPPGNADGGWQVNSYFGVEVAGNPLTTWIDYPTPLQRTTNRLELKNNARLVIVGATTGGPFAVVYGAVKFDQGSIIEVELAQSNVASNPFEIVLMRYQTSFRCNNPQTQATCSTDQCDVDATLIISNPIANRPATMICRTYVLAAPNQGVPTGWKELVVQFPAAPVATPPSSAVLPFISTITDIIVMDRSITDYPVERFLAALLNILGITPPEILIDSYIPVETARRQNGDRIRATFHCRSSISVEDANAKCQRILNEANTPGSALANELRTISTGQINDKDAHDDGSDEALYGLFALAAIPIICIVVLCLFLKNRKRQADNQYMQDTATFSNVAAQPQPINYPYPYYDPGVPAQALAYDGKAPSAIMPPPQAYPAYGY